MATVGYARTSTTEQTYGLEAQVERLKAAGCSRIFVEQASGADDARPELKRLLDFIREGDTLVVVRLDRLGRSLAHLVQVVKQLEGEDVAFSALDEGFDTSTNGGRLVFHIFGALAEFERALMLERQAAGIAKAKADGKYRGRAPTARAKAAEVRKLAASGLGATKIAGQLGIGRSSVYRVLGAR